MDEQIKEIKNNCIKDGWIKFIEKYEYMNIKYCKEKIFNEKINELCNINKLKKHLKVYNTGEHLLCLIINLIN